MSKSTITANERELLNIVRESENPTKTIMFMIDVIIDFLNQNNNTTLSDKAV